LPDDYEPAEGLPFRSEPISQEEAFKIFEHRVDAEVAERTLRMLHGLRVAGTLEDPDVLKNREPFEELIHKNGLKWLRCNHPVDEVQNAGLRAEYELKLYDMETLIDSHKIGLWHPNSGLPGTSLYEKSGLDTIREEKEKEWDEKEKLEEKRRKSQADEIRQNTGTLEARPTSQVELRRPRQNERLKYYLERAKILPDTPPEMTRFERLWPSGLVVLGTLVGCYVFTQVYTPPKNSARLWPDMPPSAATVAGILILNALVFAAWRIPPLFRLTNKNFILVPGYPFAFSIIGNVFSHQAVSHFTMNMTILWFVGTRLHDEIGRANFLAVYMASGAIGSFTSLASFVLRKNFISSTLGASGAMCGIVACYLCTNSGEKIKLFGVFPPDDWPSLSSLGLLVLMIGADVYSLWRKKPMQQSVDHWAHLGGYATGIGSAQIMMYRHRQRRDREIERRKKMGVVDRIKEGKVVK
jgi:rhomboid-like protein